ncbi:MAG: hypothetical protein II921_09195 [Treponema sp.]|nr:hypothetical protein [Treponema sp.]
MDAENLKKKLSPHDIPNGFIKVTDKPVQTLSSEQKALLNRKGNVLFNEGKIIEACRIFVTTGYSDGLTRVGDFYLKKNQDLDALKYYILAKNRRKQEVVFERLAKLLSALIK